MDEHNILITDEKGDSREYEILFTYEDEETHHWYVYYYNEDSNDVFVSRFDNGSLEPVDEDDDWDKLDNILELFLSQHDDEETEVCEGEDCDEKE